VNAPSLHAALVALAAGDVVGIPTDTVYGLAGGVWSRDLGRARAVADRMRTGTVWINDWHFFHDLAPFGGYKQSGVGREMGHLGLAEYTEVKHVHVGVEANPDAKAGHRMMVLRGRSLSYQYEPRTRVLSGPGSLARLYAELGAMGKERALVVTDEGVVKAGLLTRLREVLGLDGEVERHVPRALVAREDELHLTLLARVAVAQV